MALKRSTLASSGSGTASNDFTINVGSSGHTNVSLSTSFPSGSYICTSSLSDVTLDIYLINEDGTSAGYANATTATTTITASKSFNKVVIYGAANNDTLTFQFKYVFTPSSVTNNVGAAPKITSITISSLPNQNDTTTITGQNFAEDVEVAFTGTGYSSTAAKSIVRNSSTSLTVTRPDSFPTSASPYTITVTNPGIPNPTSTNAHILASSVTAGNAPVWVTSATLPSYVKTQSYSQSISATDADGSSLISYSVVSGSLPTDMSFNTSTGAFSGTPSSNSGSPHTYTVRATDSGGNYVDRAFTVQQSVPDAPIVGTVTIAGTTASIPFTAPSFAGSSSITGYTVSSNTGGFTASGTSSPISIAGLTPNSSYTFTVVATNSSGNSVSSSASNSVTAQITAPGAPTGVSASMNVNSATISFTTPSFNGGATISGYTVTSSPGGLTSTGSSSPLTITGLSPSTAYTFSVVATNSAGNSSAGTGSGTTNALPSPQLFTGSGTYTPNYYPFKYVVHGRGGGGGGGGYRVLSHPNLTGSTYGGGGAGGYYGTINARTINSGSITIAIGNGGAGGTNTGQTGGSTTVNDSAGSVITILGGGAGGGSGGNASDGGGSGGSGGGGAAGDLEPGYGSWGAGNGGSFGADAPTWGGQGKYGGPGGGSGAIHAGAGGGGGGGGSPGSSNFLPGTNTSANVGRGGNGGQGNGSPGALVIFPTA